MKVTNPGKSATDTNNLNGFFALLYKVDQRNKREEKNRNKKSEKDEELQIKNED